MTDDDFLTAMRIRSDSPDWARLSEADPLTAALRIDDLRSTYCEHLERRISEQALEIDGLRRLLSMKPIQSNTSH